MRILVLVTDAFGGYGGIALYNRDLLRALCNLPGCEEVVVVPRLMPDPPGELPERLTLVTDSLGGKAAYLKALFATVRKNSRFDLIVCGHINLTPIAWLLKLWLRAPVVLEIYGIDAWQPTPSRLANALVKQMDRVISISDLTLKRFLAWSNFPEERSALLPNAIHAEQYGPGSKNALLLERYSLTGKTVIMTLGRLAAEEQYKGFDEVLNIMPDLVREYPDLAYLIVGDGSDRARLEAKAAALGLAGRVVFAGRVSEEDKADHFRLADAYVMPSSGEGFGFVFLEALACGIPVVASRTDGSREAVREGELGLLVDPADPAELLAAVRAVLDKPRGVVPEGLAYFAFPRFAERLQTILRQGLGR